MLIRFIANRISFIINYCPKYVEWNELAYKVVGGKGGWLENVGHQMLRKRPQRHRHPFIMASAITDDWSQE